MRLLLLCPHYGGLLLIKDESNGGLRTILAYMNIFVWMDHVKRAQPQG